MRTPGGTFDEIKRKTVYEPFRQATGIEIVPVASARGGMLALFKSGEIQVDLIESFEDSLLELEYAGSLLPIDYAAFKFTDPADIDPAVRSRYRVGSLMFASVLGFDTTAYQVGKEPRSWTEFWDIKAFPGRRSLAGMASGAPNLEQALLADGVAMDKLYPLDIDRAFRSLSRIKPAIHKFWDSGPASAQELAGKGSVLGVVWNTHLQLSIAGGAKLAAQWNQNQVQVGAYGIPKNSRDPAAAIRFIDYTLSPEVQARWLSAYRGVPCNRKAYPSIAKELIDPVNGLPWTRSRGFMTDVKWWADNRTRVGRAWSNWIL